MDEATNFIQITFLTLPYICLYQMSLNKQKCAICGNLIKGASFLLKGKSKHSKLTNIWQCQECYLNEKES